MSYITRRSDAPNRHAPDIGPGDYVKIGSHWEKVASNNIFGGSVSDSPTFKAGNWSVTTEDGRSHSGWGINNYAKAEDMEKR